MTAALLPGLPSAFGSVRRPATRRLLDLHLVEGLIEHRFSGDLDEILHRHAELPGEQEQRVQGGVAVPAFESGKEPEGEDLRGSFLLGELSTPSRLAGVHAHELRVAAEVHEGTSRQGCPSRQTTKGMVSLSLRKRPRPS